MATYRWVATDLRTNALLAELPLTDVTFGEVLNGAGEFSATLPLASRGQLVGGSALLDASGDPILDGTGAPLISGPGPAVPPMLATLWTSSSQPGRTAVWCVRNDSVVGGAIIWVRRRGMARPAELSGAGFWSLFRLQHLRVSKSYTATDQLAIARDLVTTAQAVTGANIGVTVGAEASPVSRTVAWAAYELKNLGEAVEELAGLDAGFDFAVDLTPSLGKVLTLSYPRRGRIAGATGIVFAAGKNLLDYEVIEDDSASARTYTAIGSGDGEDMLVSTATRTDLIDNGYPLTSQVGSWKDETVAANLNARAIAGAAAYAQTPTKWRVTIDPDDVDGGLGTFITGDEVLLVIDDDENFPAQDDGSPGYERFHRVLSYRVTVDGDGVETLTVELGDVA